MSKHSVNLTAIPLVKPGDDLAALLIEALDGAAIVPGDHDIVVVTRSDAHCEMTA